MRQGASEEMDEVGTLSPVDVRQVWADEARDFTPWLAENADLLGEALGMDLIHEQSEAAVGRFSADLVFREASTDRCVVVENIFAPYRTGITRAVKEKVMESKTLQETVLSLPPDERAALAERLLLSLDEPSEEELAQIWLSEADKRARELDHGEVRSIPAEEVRRKARALLR